MVHQGDLCLWEVHSVAWQNVMCRWCTRRFWLFVISSGHDGAQYDVVSLAVHALAADLFDILSRLLARLGLVIPILGKTQPLPSAGPNYIDTKCELCYTLYIAYIQDAGSVWRLGWGQKNTCKFHEICFFSLFSIWNRFAAAVWTTQASAIYIVTREAIPWTHGIHNRILAQSVPSWT